MTGLNTPQVILILGMHRSGTSALTRVMSLLGAKLPKTLLGKNESNNRGHWESEVLIASHDGVLKKMKSEWKDWRRLRIDSLSSARRRALKDSFAEDITQEYGGSNRLASAQEVLVIKEPRICRFSGVYLEALDELCANQSGANEGKDGNVHCIIAVRHPLEVAASLTSRDNIPKIDGLFLWLTHMLEAEHASRSRSRSFITYDSFLKSPVKCSKALAGDMPFALPYSADERRGEIEGYVNPSLKRHVLPDEDIVLDPLARGWINESYEAFQVLSENPKSQAALDVLDRVRPAYFAALEPMFAVLAEQRAMQNAQESVFNTEIQKLQEALTENKSVIELYKDEAKAQAAKAASLTSKLTSSEGVLASYKDEAQAQETKAASLADKLASSESALASYKDEAQAQETKAASLADKLASSESALISYKDEAKAQESRARAYQQQLESSEAAVQAYKNEAQAQEAKAADYQAEAAALSSEIDFMRGEFRGLLSEADSKIEGLYGELSSRDEALRARSAQAESISRELDTVLKSSSWKMTSGLRGLVNLLRGKNAERPARALEDKGDTVKLDYKPWNSDT